MDRVKGAAVSCCNSVVLTICMGIGLIIPIAMISVGTIYKDQCPYERMIPIYLIVGGVFGVLQCISGICKRHDKDNKSTPFDVIVGLFLFAWFIAGNVWILGIFKDVNVESAEDEKYCQSTVYYFGFGLTVATWCLLPVFIVICCCLCCCSMFCRSQDN